MDELLRLGIIFGKEVLKYFLIFLLIFGLTNYVQFEAQTCQITGNLVPEYIRDNQTALFYMQGYKQEIVNGHLAINCTWEFENVLKTFQKMEADKTIKIGDYNGTIFEERFTESIRE